MESDQTKLPLLATRVINTPLMIEPGKLHIILQAIGSRIGLNASDIQLNLPESSISAKKKTAAQTPGIELNENIAIIPIYGTLVHKASGMDAESGLTSYEAIRRSFKAAIEDPSIESILLDVDSPGGEVSGVIDLVDYIYESRGIKPIDAAVNEIAFSAAYAITSAADRIYMPRTGILGSIGVIAIHMDQSGFDEKLGVKYTAIYAGKHKNDFTPHEPLSKDAQSALQKDIDQIYSLFISTVARNRNLNESTIRDTAAKTYLGNNAILLGLADELSPLEKTLINIKHEGGRTKMEKLTIELLKTENKDIYDQVFTLGKESVTLKDFKSEIDKLTADATNAEHDRIMGIFTKAYGEEMAAKFTKVVAPGATITDMMEFAQDKAKADILAKITSESPESVGQELTTEDKLSGLSDDERLLAEFKGSPELKAEYGSVEAYVAYKKAEEAGRIKSLKKK